jgi:hypothetical protein
MKQKDIRQYVRLAARWDFICIVCGNGFETVACMTREHIIPRSRGGKKRYKQADNIAPAHFRCNQLKGNHGLLESQLVLERKMVTMPAHAFKAWLNARVPDRVVPEDAMVPPQFHLAAGQRRQRACIQLPKHLSGMR